MHEGVKGHKSSQIYHKSIALMVLFYLCTIYVDLCL